MNRDDDAGARPPAGSVEATDGYRSIFDLSPQPMWMYDRRTLRFVAVNEAAIRHYGYSRDEFAAMTIADIRPPADLPALREDLARSSEPSSPPRLWRHRKKDGTLIHVEVTANDFSFGGKDVRLVLVNDVTARERSQEALRRTEEQLRHAQKMDALGRLAGGVAHDINNVLTVVQSYASMLEDNEELPASHREDAAEIRRATERAVGITRQLLTLSRHARVRIESVDLNDVIDKFAPMLRRLLGEQVALVVHRGQIPPVLADRGQLEQVIMNIAINARDAMPSGGRLTIETSVVDLTEDAVATHGLAPGRYVVAALTDTGVGMDEDTRRKIFEPFFTTKELGKGTGLGLSIVHGIVTQSGGAVSVYSEPRHGTTFRIQLPVAGGAVTTPTVEAATSARTLPPITVLVVDDDRDVRTVAVRVLQDAGCKILDAATSDEARRVCVAHDGPIDVALVDVVLSDGRGDLLADQLCDLRADLKVLLMSGYPAGALSVGGGIPPDMLAKPFSPAELRGAIARLIGADLARAPATRRRSDPHLLPRVVIADDDDTLQRTLARVLKRAGFDVAPASTGKQATEAVRAARTDVIVSDIHMPDGNGLDLIRAVRGFDLDVPVILMTGAPDVRAAAAAVEYGAFRFLTKPINIDELARLVHHASRAHALARIRREAFSIGGGVGGIVADRAGLEVRFESAVDQLWIAFQPIVDARTNAPFAVEALMRSDEASMASPLALLDAATHLGRLPKLGRSVRRVAARCLGTHDSSLLFVNLHPDDLLDADLIDPAGPLTQIASRVVLEITERASLASSARLTDRLARLRALGFRLAVDDIGAGYSGLTSFTELQPEFVKIDMSLVRDVHKSALKQRTISALCRLCHESNALVVGEGVETLAERDMLVALGCDLLQGYFIGRPTRA